MDWDPDSYERNTRFVSELGMPVVELLRPVAGECILDLGCGDGALTLKLMDMGCRVTGIDASAEMVAAARKCGVDARVMDSHELPFVEEYDAVFSNAALHWMRQPDRVIEGVWRSLKRPGRYVGEMGGRGNVDKLHTALLQGMADRGVAPESVDPWYFPSPGEYRKKLEAAGFSVDTIELIDRPTPLPTGVGGWIESVARPFLAAVAPAQRAGLVLEVEDRVRPFLCDEQGVWSADYVRLRFSAFKGQEPVRK